MWERMEKELDQRELRDRQDQNVFYTCMKFSDNKNELLQSLTN